VIVPAVTEKLQRTDCQPFPFHRSSSPLLVHRRLSMISTFPSLIRVSGFWLFLLPSLALAQGNSGNAGKKADDTPEAQWATLVSLTKTTPGNSVSARDKAPIPFTFSLSQKRADFYRSQHPAHAPSIQRSPLFHHA